MGENFVITLVEKLLFLEVGKNVVGHVPFDFFEFLFRAGGSYGGGRTKLRQKVVAVVIAVSGDGERNHFAFLLFDFFEILDGKYVVGFVEYSVVNVFCHGFCHALRVRQTFFKVFLKFSVKRSGRGKEKIGYGI